jgi:phospholipid/cholesterol/gamma-HCH transport system permease protein
MEASTLRQPKTRGGGDAPGGPSALREFGKNLSDPFRALVHETGAMGAFGFRAYAELPRTWRYFSEILRQSGIIIVGSAAVICFMTFVMGSECGLESDYVLRGYGATVYSGVFDSFCNVRECLPYMWGYIFSAKIGCGLVAEVGSMRISEELDAMESQGLNPMRYVVGTRILAGIITFPLIFFVALGTIDLAAYLIVTQNLGDVSSGGWSLIFWEFQSPLDILYSFIKVMSESFFIVTVALYYGWTAKGGPVGVGTNTAKSMIINLIAVHVLGSFWTMIFWGLNPNAPVGG